MIAHLTTRRARWCAAALGLTLAAPARAQAPARAAAGPAPLIPLEQLFDNPEITGAQISPDGRFLSYLKPYQGKLNVHVRPVGGGAERRMTSDTVRPVGGYFWSADGRFVLYSQDKGGNENFRIYAVPAAAAAGAASADAPAARDLTPFDNVRAQIFAVPRDLPGRILVGLNRRTPSAFDAYWLDLATGQLTLAVQNPGRHGAYLLDKQHQVRVATGQSPTGGTEIYARVGTDTAWRTVASYPVTENAAPIRVHPDGRRVYVSTDHGNTDLQRLVLLDLATGAETPVERDPKNEVDFGGALFSEVTDSLLATIYVADTVRIYPKTLQMTRDLARIRRLHDGTPNFTSTTRDETKWMVTFDSPTDPGATYLYDRTTGRGQFLFRPRPWLQQQRLTGMRPVSFPARDGLRVHGYLSTPAGVAARNLPLVLVVHGGPWARDTWGYDPEAQLLANRGYAVMQINYRGSTGYGKRFLNAAVHEWSGKMHTDLLDGVSWAVKQGIADSARVAIYGGSYGGYATLVGLTFTPERFACGVDYVGPSSLVTLIESFPAYWKPFLEGTFYRHVGNPANAAEREDMRRRSPLFLVDRIAKPLLIVQGANDPRVTKLEADQMAIALRDRGVKVRYLLAPNEGHGFANADNRLALYRSMEQFFGECLGGRVQPSVSPRVDARIRELTVGVDTLKLAPARALAAPRTLLVGDALVSGASLAPSRSTMRLVLVQNGQEREVGTITDELTAATANGQPALRRVQTINSPMLGVSADTITVLRATLAPVSHRGANARQRLALDFDGAKVRGTVTPAGGAAQPITLAGDTALFDTSTLDLAVRTLPLAEGYAVRMPGYLYEGGGKTWVTSRVTGSEPVTVGGRTVDAWRVEAEIAGQKVTHLIAKDTKEILRTSFAPAPGVELRMVK